jgi:hypothetical protein
MFILYFILLLLQSLDLILIRENKVVFFVSYTFTKFCYRSPLLIFAENRISDEVVKETFSKTKINLAKRLHGGR